MNERIKELEKQCWDNQTNHLNTEKFAELIVQECVNICESGSSTQMTCGGAAMLIKQKFGVEE